MINVKFETTMPAHIWQSRWQHLDVVHVVWHRVPKEVPSIPNVRSPDVCYNMQDTIHQDLGETCHFRLQTTALLPLLLLFILSCVPSAASFFCSLISPMLLHSSASFHFHRLPSSHLPWRRRLCFFSQTSIIHMRLHVLITHINTAAISQHLQASAITFGNTNSAMDFPRNKKRSTNINSVSTDHSRHTHLEDTEDEPNSEEKHDWI